MRLNNKINSPTNSLGWASFTTTVSATTTNPTSGTIAVNVSYYLQMGKMLYIKYNYKQTAAGTAGSGTYLFNIPTGFTIDTSIMAATQYPCFGSAGLFDTTAGQSGLGYPYVVDNTHYAILANESGTTTIQPISDVWFAFGDAISYSVSLKIPIL